MGEKLIHINQLAENYFQEHIAALLALHAFTGTDCTCAFKGKGKARLIKLLSQNSMFIQLFAAVGSTWKLDDERILTGIEQFTGRLYGGGPRVKEVDVAREVKVKKICGSSLHLRPRPINLPTVQKGIRPAYHESQFPSLYLAQGLRSLTRNTLPP